MSKWKLTWRNTAGAKALRRYLGDDRETPGTGQASLAKRLGVTPTTVYAWTVGFRRPGHELRAALETLTKNGPVKIPADSWLTPKEAARAKRLAALRAA